MVLMLFFLVDSDNLKKAFLSRISCASSGSNFCFFSPSAFLMLARLLPILNLISANLLFHSFAFLAILSF